MFAFRAVVVLMARELPPGETVFLWEVLMAAGDHLTEPEYEPDVGGGFRWNKSGGGGAATRDENADVTTGKMTNLEKNTGEEEVASSSGEGDGDRDGDGDGDGDGAGEDDRDSVGAGAGAGFGVSVASDPRHGGSRKPRVFRPEDGAGGGTFFLHVVAAAFLQSRNVVFGCHEFDDLLHASHHTIASKNTGASALLASARRLMAVQ